MKKIITAVCATTILNFTVSASDSIETSGDILRLLIPAIAYGATFYIDDEEGREQFYKSFATNGVATYGLKYTVNKERPNGEDYSFPSGHASVTMQSATFIHKRYGLKYAIPAYIGATFTGYSRVESDNHYTIDVLAGAAIGALSSYYFTTEFKGYTITPKVNSGIFGLTFTKK
jgi:membrane-associated phospholipid phosphatase